MLRKIGALLLSVLVLPSFSFGFCLVELPLGSASIHYYQGWEVESSPVDFLVISPDKNPNAKLKTGYTYGLPGGGCPAPTTFVAAGETTLFDGDFPADCTVSGDDNLAVLAASATIQNASISGPKGSQQPTGQLFKCTLSVINLQTLQFEVVYRSVFRQDASFPGGVADFLLTVDSF